MAGRAGRAGEGGRVETREENAFDGVRALDGEARRAGETSKSCICSNGVRHLEHVATVVVLLSVYTPSCLARWRPTTPTGPARRPHLATLSNTTAATIGVRALGNAHHTG